MLVSQKFVLSSCMCNKVPYINGVLLLLLALYFFWICVCLHMLCIKVHRKTSVGGTHRDNKTKFDHENHEIWEVMRHEPHPMRQAPNRLWSRPLGLLFGLPGLLKHRHTSCFVHGQVCGLYTLFSYVTLSVLK
jgi:hypothetical protein